MEGVALGVGIVATVLELYKVVEKAYDIYLGVKEFRSTLHELHLCMEIERFRLKQWGDHILPKPHKKHVILGLAKAFKFTLRDRDKLEKRIIKLKQWNDSLVQMTSRSGQESARRRLRTRFSTSDVDQLHQLELAAALLQHRDIESMAITRGLIEEGHRKESFDDEEGFKILRTQSQYHLELDDLLYEGNPYKTETNRATAIYRGESVIIDWRSVRDDTWRKENPVAFRLRTENLAKVLNTDLRPLNLCVLHCVGYLDRSTNVTGYAFRPPPEEAHDIAELGQRFKVAQALVSTICEIHNLGWIHKNLQPKNILFWPKPGTNNKDPNLDKPYIVGFDVSRLNRPDEKSEKPTSGIEDDLYRHPSYKGDNPRSSFLPSFDMYSLGVILYEIGMWRTVGSKGRHGNSGRGMLRPPSPTPSPYSQRYRSRSSSPIPMALHTADVIDPEYVEHVVLNGLVMDLKRYMGERYKDAVVSCLNKELDVLWEDEKAELGERLRVYLGAVQNQVLDPITLCNA